MDLSTPDVVRDELLRNNSTFRELVHQHQSFEARLSELAHLTYPNDDEQLARYATEHVNEAGNGAEEIRNWLIAHGAAAGARFEVQYYKPLPCWYAGIGLARWHVAAS